MADTDSTRIVDQPSPIPNDSRPVIDSAHELIERRRAVGLERYKTPLQVGNGRDFGRDADEEIADFFIYWTGLRIEQQAELARLRAIEDAARKLRAFHAQWCRHEVRGECECGLAQLKAALEVPHE